MDPLELDTGSCELPNMVMRTDLGPLQQSQELLNTGPSLWTLKNHLLKVNISVSLQQESVLPGQYGEHLAALLFIHLILATSWK